jgi:hypothetical protein
MLLFVDELLTKDNLK